MMAYRERGWTLAKIGRKFGMTRQGVYWYIGKSKKSVSSRTIGRQRAG